MTIIAVPGARGAQASAIARRLEAAGFVVRRLSRTGGDGCAEVDTDREESLARAFEGAAGVAFTVPQDYRAGVREAYAERVVRAGERAGVERLVVNMAGPIYDDLDHPIAHDLRRIREILRSGSVPTSVLQPTTFLDNLRAPWAVAAISDGVLPYPAPAGARLSWVSHDSLGDFVAAAFRTNAAGGVFKVGGPAPVTGQEVADAIGRAAQRPVRYVELPRDQFAAALDAEFGAPAGDHIASLYGHLAVNPDAGALDPSEWAPLGVTPEPVESWAARHAWRAPAEAQA